MHRSDCQQREALVPKSILSNAFYSFVINWFIACMHDAWLSHFLKTKQQLVKKILSVQEFWLTSIGAIAYLMFFFASHPLVWFTEKLFYIFRFLLNHFKTFYSFDGDLVTLGQNLPQTQMLSHQGNYFFFFFFLFLFVLLHLKLKKWME